MTTEGIAHVDRKSGSGGSEWLSETFGSPDEELPPPTCERVDEDVDLAAEGLDMDALRQRLRPSTSASRTVGKAKETETAPTSEELSSEAAASITARLDAIESQLDGTTHTARVIDAGDDITLLRVLGGIDAEHGQTVEVTVRDSSEGAE